MANTLPGQVPGTIQLLRTDAAREQAPDLFDKDEDGLEYFNELAAHGNDGWVDFWPELVLLVRNEAGEVVVASNASDWHMTNVGYPVPEPVPAT